MSPKNAIRLLLVLALVGLVVPWYFHAAFLLDGGSFAPAPFLAAVSANKLVAGITWDVYLAAAAFSVWVLQDAPSAGIRRPWIYVALTFVVGLAFVLPLYIALRKARSERFQEHEHGHPLDKNGPGTLRRAQQRGR